MLQKFFTSSQIHSHSQKAFRILSNYCIGTTNETYLVKKDDCENNLIDLVDMNKAILPQVLNMDPSKYQAWLHQANGTNQMRIFESNFLESLSRYPWWYIFWMWIPVICFTFYLAIMNGNSVTSCLSSFIFGIFIWGFIEYTFHRFLFHIETSSKIGNFYHLFAHGLHHLSPLDPTRLTFPPIFSVVIGIVFYKFFQSFNDIFPTIQAIYSGAALGYMLYDACHYYFHHGTLKIGYLQWMKTRHLLHHYKDTSKNFGVTSPFFDILFGTSE